ncbi:MAG: flagellar transcriptional regulator FlhC [Gallionella sp.]|nr:flagellar transcriptional regulator FlhC [Gallionella sp.]
MRNKSVVNEAREIQIAVELVNLGARLQLLQEETHLSRERLLKLYKEVKGESPSKGMLPYSTDWFMSWSANIHSSLFMGIHQFMLKHTGLSGVEALIKSYRLYLEQAESGEDEPVLSITRAWFLIRFFDAEMMQLTTCHECGGQFVVHTHELCDTYTCGICKPPSRAGKTKKSRQVENSATVSG